MKEIIKEMLFDDIELLEKLAANGDEDAAFCLGYRRYMNGDFDEAQELLLPFANEGEAEAQYYVGCCLVEDGREDEAYRYFLLSGMRGNADSAYMLVNYYHYGGDGVEKDDEEALRWLKAAADGGVYYACLELADLTDTFLWDDGEEFEGEIPTDITADYYRELAKRREN